jgi:hypothetical protein
MQVKLSRRKTAMSRIGKGREPPAVSEKPTEYDGGMARRKRVVGRTSGE